MTTTPTPLVAGMAGAVALPDVEIPEGGSISFVTDNLAAADNWGLGGLEVDEWLVF
jgi:hypothetical protein